MHKLSAGGGADGRSLTLQRSICILALSPIADDPRVCRQVEAFNSASWTVSVVGLSSRTARRLRWPILTVDDPGVPPVWEDQNEQVRLTAGRSRQIWSAANSAKRRLIRGLRVVGLGGVADFLHALKKRLYLGFTRLRPNFAQRVFWRYVDRAGDIYRRALQVEALIWLANDWAMLPVAARLARERGGIYGYDTHEFATEEYAENWRWRLFQRPMVGAIEREYIRDAAVVSAVSSGIAERLDRLYLLPRASLTIRNTPEYQEVPFRPTRRDRIDVLYHGIVVANRGLEAAVDSVPLWRPEFTLTIRGPENPAFSPALRERIAALGLQDRVRLAPAVPMTDLVREAAAFDVGFFALPGHSHHNEFALPNKFFEYVMAGLALCTTDLPEMARLIRQYDLGLTIAAVEPAAIAAAINALDPERIDRFKRNALAAARELCWERESERLIAAYDAALSMTRAKTV